MNANNSVDYLSRVKAIEAKVRSGVYPDSNEIALMNSISLEFLSIAALSNYQIDVIESILIISDILYNNTNRNVLPLDDGIYDLLVEKYKMYRPFEVHADPVLFNNTESSFEIPNDQLVEPIQFIDRQMAEDSLFINKDNLLKIIDPRVMVPMPYYPLEQQKPIKKINVNVPHKYPKLVGTLDKCKFTLLTEAMDKGFENVNDDAIKIFERDFIGVHIQQGYYGPYDPIDLVAELKYDGVSVEAEVTDKIISARSRGDTDANIAADFTPIFGGMEFPYAPHVFDGEDAKPFGMKFEAIITKDNLERLNKLRGVNYVNCRVAIIGLLGASDAYKYRNFITLIPLATSLDIDRQTELEFMNRYYNMGELNRYSIIHANNHTEAIFQVYKFVEESMKIRDVMPYMYDGVVISYLDQRLRQALGRRGAINKFSIAIKFSPLKKQTIFTGYTFTVGQNGVITPLLHYNPVEFYGSIHTKSSGHSYSRFRELNLRAGDIIDVEYTNDVMPYATKAMVEDNLHNPNPVIQFPTHCPSCGSPLEFTNRSAICTNRNCPERLYNRMANMVKVLGIKDFSLERVKLLNIRNLKDLANLSEETAAKILGKNNGKKLFTRIHKALYSGKKDYVIVSSLGFENISNLTWKKIFENMSFGTFIQFMIDANYNGLYNSLVKIKSIGPATAETIVENVKYADIKNDLAFIMTLATSGYINFSYSDEPKVYRGVVRFSGVRDPDLELLLSKNGYDCSGTAGVTKKTDILIIPYAGYTSSKVSKLRPGAVLLPIDEARYRLLGFV